MIGRRFTVAAGILAVCGVFAFCAATTAPSPAEAQQDSLVTRYARVRLKMSEIAVQKARDMNKKVPGTIPGDLIAQYADDVEIAKLQLQATQRAGGADPLQEWLLRVELALRSAEHLYKNAERAENGTPGTYQPIDIERLRLAVEAAQLQVERGRSLVKASPEAKLQWVVDVMSDELLRVKKRTSLLVQVQGPSEL